MSLYCYETHELLTRQRSILVFDCIIPKRRSLMMALMIFRRVNVLWKFSTIIHASSFSDGYRDSLTRQLWHQLTMVFFHVIPVCQCVLTNFLIIMRRISVRQYSFILLYHNVNSMWMCFCLWFCRHKWCFSRYFNASIYGMGFTMRQHMTQNFHDIQIWNFHRTIWRSPMTRGFFWITMPHYIMLPHVPVLISCSNTILI